jgi:glycosyltransferase involved in cell wall biosynthesis
MRALFRSWGFQSEIFTEPQSILPELAHDCHDVSTLSSLVTEQDTVLLHFSIGSDVNEHLAGLPCRKVLRYHNITPHTYFTPVNSATAACLRRGRKQIESLAGAADINIAVSSYNAKELEDSGYKDVAVLPIILDREVLEGRSDRKAAKQFAKTGTNILFVGRCAPNKCIEDLVQQFYYYHRFYNRDSTLIHVGSYNGTERYHYLIRGLVTSLGITEHVKFLGSVPQPVLNAAYRSADIFLSMSEHEGFCIPVIEAMYNKLPVVAYASSAVPDTMGGAGVLFRKKDYPTVAETMHRIASAKSLKDSIIRAQDSRIASYFARDFETELRSIILPDSP